MTIYNKLYTNSGTKEITVSDEAAELVRVDFNPSELGEVTEIKALSAVLITRIQQMPRSRHQSLAVTAVEEASMWAVKAATSGLE